MTLRGGKLFNNKLKFPKRKTSQPTCLDPVPPNDSSLNDPEENRPPVYIHNALFPQRSKKLKKETSIGEIIEIFK